MGDNCGKCGQIAIHHVDGYCPIYLNIHGITFVDRSYEAMADKKKGGGKTKRDFVVMVRMKKGGVKQYFCGTSIRAANIVCEVIREFGGEAVAKLAIIAKEHKATSRGDGTISQEDWDAQG